MKNIEESRNYFIKEIGQHELISKNHKNGCTALNHIKNFLFFSFCVNWIISISLFASLLGIPIGITSFSIGLKTCTITSGIKKCKSIAKKKNKKHD